MMASVVIFCCTYQGECFLTAQLDSIIAQSYPFWKIVVSDDGSTDDTQHILQRYQNKLGDEILKICDGPKKGFVKNFLSLVSRELIKPDNYYAYSDQDDIWKCDKLERAVKWLKTIPNDIPAIYCSRTELINSRGQTIGYSPLFKKSPSFANALVQSPFGGNTMVFNAAACDLLQETSKDINVSSHDWWSYILVSACGGKIFYDSYPSVYYRQHTANLVGSNATLSAKFVRVKKLFKGEFKEMNLNNIQYLENASSKLTPQNRKILDLFYETRSPFLFARLIAMKRSGIYRLTPLGQLGLITGIFFNKV